MRSVFFTAIFCTCVSTLSASAAPASHTRGLFAFGNNQFALSQAPAQTASHLQRANEYLREKKPELAIPEFAAVVAADPNNLEAQANLGVLLFFSGKSSEAETHLRAALAIDPSNSKLQVLLGTSEHRAGKLAEARKDLTSAMPSIQDPKVHKQAGLEIIEIDTALDDLTAAATLADQLKTEFATDPEVLFAAYRTHSDLSDEALLDMSLVAPQSSQLHQAMAHELLRERDNKGAIENMREALKLNPNLPGGHYELAELLHVSPAPADKAEAAKEYEAAVKQQPNDAPALTRLGDIAGETEDHAGAVARYKQALVVQPNYPEAQIGLAYQLSEAGHPDRALPLLEQVVKADPLNMLVHYRLSAVYRRLHRPDDAKREITEYQKLKTMKENLHSLYDSMRLGEAQDGDAKK